MKERLPHDHYERRDDLHRVHRRRRRVRIQPQARLQRLRAAPARLLRAQAAQRARKVRPAQVGCGGRRGGRHGDFAVGRAVVIRRELPVVAPRSVRRLQDVRRRLHALARHLGDGARRGDLSDVEVGGHRVVLARVRHDVAADDDEEHEHQNGEVRERVEVQPEALGLLAEELVRGEERERALARRDVHAAAGWGEDEGRG
eukprot:24566-Pelagococcus_subviridis.AAC.15